jgi:dTDP-4-dehydrorhamnose 3,5-epimerase
MQINHTSTGRRGTVRGMHDQCTLVVTEGFAHGFQTLTDDCELLHSHTAAFAPDSEGALNANDPRLVIAWPQSISHLSARDAGHQLLDDEFSGIN